jgi:two-component system NarL family sensor kinase
MPQVDNYNNEVLADSLAGIMIFFIIICTVVVILLLYQRKKARHQQQIGDMKKRFSEELLKSQLEMQEETFNRISQEIHDNVGQVMSLAKVQVNIMTESNDMNKDMLNDVKLNIGKAMTDLRDIARSLSSDRIRSISVHTAALTEAERLNKSGIIHINVEVEGQERKMREDKKLILFRIIQESIQNIIKHAKASETTIRFSYNADEVETVIRDNGQGFDIDEATSRSSGLGLSNIKTRAMLAGGRSRIESRLETGTTIIINMPYE